MSSFLKPPPPKEQLPKERIDSHYRWLREQVFFGTFVGYAAYYLLRNNSSFAVPTLEAQGFTKWEASLPMTAVTLAYGLSKFLMGSVSDRSNARYFITIGLLLSAAINVLVGFWEFATTSIVMLVVLMFLNGWFQGMGWPACGRSMVHWFSVSERGTRMSIWNTAHNVGAGLIGLLIPLGIMIFAYFMSIEYVPPEPGEKVVVMGPHVMPGIYAFPAFIATGIAILVFFLMRDTPQSCGLPPIEEYKNEYPDNYSETSEKEMTAKEIFFKHVFNNKFLWYIAIANAFIYLVRYGISNWIPSYLNDVKGYDLEAAGWAYLCYEYAGIPGTILCGWLSDRYFRGHRAPACILFMALVTVFVIAYWLNPLTNPIADYLILIALGFLIYGPVMLIGLFALDLVAKKAAGTAAGLTGLFGYLGGGMVANIGMGAIAGSLGWNTGFIVLILACLLSIFFVALTMSKPLVNETKNISSENTENT